MHLKRNEANPQLPIPRKGTTYVARAFRHHNDSVPVIIALREMLKLVDNVKEAKKLISQKIIKINGRIVKDHRESICLFNLFEAGKIYRLVLTKNGRFMFEEAKTKDEHLCKIIGKKILSGGKLQINCHDGFNSLSDNKKISVNDSVYVDLFGKVKKHVALDKGSSVFVISGKYAGLKGKVESVSGKKAKVNLTDKEASAELPVSVIVAE